jgi:hypothetical protein
MHAPDKDDPFKELLSEQQPDWPAVLAYESFDKTPTEAPKPLIKNLLDCGTRILFGGGSKTFKTWIQCDLALSLASAIPWLGFELFKARVLYVNFELRDYYMQYRLRSICEARKIKPPQNLFVWNLRNFPISRGAFCLILLSQCKNLGVDIAFIDPFYKLLAQTEDENSQTDMAAVLRAFDPVNLAGVSTAFGIHFSKGCQAGKEPEDRISGAGTIARDADNIITLTKHEENGAFTLDFVIRDHPPIDSFVVRWDSPIMVRTDLDPAKIKTLGRKPSHDPEDLFTLLKTHDDELSRADFARLATDELGWSRRTVYDKLACLFSQKRVFTSKTSGFLNVCAGK